MKKTWFLALVLISAAPVAAQPTVDGTRDASYGGPLAVQTVQTQFGDAMPPGSLGGGELDAAYGVVSGGRLYVMLTGNQEPNFNKMDIFIDSKAGGEQTLSATPDYDFNGGGGWISSNLGGLTFDTGFEADYHLFGRWGNLNDGYEMDIIDRNGGTTALVNGSSGQASSGSGTLIHSGTIAAGAAANNTTPLLTQALHFAINNTNTAGVIGGTGAADQVAAAAVTTGIEFSVALADIGNPAPGSLIKISAMYNNGDHNFLSNQMLGGLPAGTGNLGNPAGVDQRQYPGDQFFSVKVVPEPTGLALCVLAGLGLGRRRRPSA